MRPIFKLVIATITLTISMVSVANAGNNISEAELLQAARDGSLDAQVTLGRLYSSRKKEFQSYKKAHYWLRKAVDRGSFKAMRLMALMYVQGRVIEPDYSEAAYWLGRGSAAGDLNATYNLAYYYLEGTGVDKNIAKGTTLLKENAMQGHAYSIDHFVEQAEKNSTEARQFLEQLYAEKRYDTEAFKKYRQEIN